MDTKLIEYIIKIADEKSITKAADKLFITQSALSQQLQKLEKELDTSLFVRNKSDWTPTPEGEVYLENAREILRIKKRTYSVISDMACAHKNYLSIGLSAGRGPEMFTQVYPLFHQKFPLTTVEPRELNVKMQQEQIRKGNLDLGFMTLLDSQRTIDTYIDLLEEEFFIGVPTHHPLPEISEPFDEDNPESYPEIDLDFFRNDSFVLLYKESTVCVIMDSIFKNAGFTPNILFETSSTHTVLSMIQANLCVGLIPFHYVKLRPEGVRFFRIPNHPHWTVCASYRKDAYLSRAAKTFIELARDYWIS